MDAGARSPGCGCQNALEEIRVATVFDCKWRDIHVGPPRQEDGWAYPFGEALRWNPVFGAFGAYFLLVDCCLIGNGIGL